MAEKRRALIIASYEYEDSDLRQLVAPAQDAEALSRVLADPTIGGFEVRLCLNEPKHKVEQEVDAFFVDRKRDDLLLLYFSCHGIKDVDGRLYFAAADTRRKLLRSTAVSANFVNDVMHQSLSRRQVLLLDCCYSGAFAKGMVAKAGTEISTKEHFEGRGRVVLTASDAMQYSYEGDKVAGEGVHSVFTRSLLHGLETGEADLDGDGRISLDELYNYVHDRVADETPQQRPGKWAFDVHGEIVIARNPRPVVKPAELPRELQQTIDDPRHWVREGAVHELDRLLRGSNKGLALAAEAALTLLTEDDSRRVSAAAAQSLAAYAEAQAARKAQEEEQRQAEAQAARKAQQEDQRRAEAQAARKAQQEEQRRAEAQAARKAQEEEQRRAEAQAARKTQEVWHGPKIAGIWLGCALAFIVLSVVIFEGNNIRWFGMDDSDSGAFFGSLVALGSGLYLVWKRWRELRGTELALYWLGCAVAFTVLLGVIFMENNIRWFGMHDEVSGFFFGSLVALGSGLYLTWKRWREVTGVELALYWLGCAVAFIFLSAVLFDEWDIDWFGMDDDLSGAFFGSLVALGSGLYLTWKRWREVTGVELALYWHGCVFAFILFSVVLFHEWNIDWFGMDNEASGAFFGWLVGTIGGWVMFWQLNPTRRSKYTSSIIALPLFVYFGALSGGIARVLLKGVFGYEITRWGLSSGIFWGILSMAILFGCKELLQLNNTQIVHWSLFVMGGAFVGDITSKPFTEALGGEITRWGLSSGIFWGILSMAILFGCKELLQLNNTQIVHWSLFVMGGAFVGDYARDLLRSEVLGDVIMRWGASDGVFWGMLSMGALFGGKKILGLNNTQIIYGSLFVVIGAFVGRIAANVLILPGEIMRMGLSSGVFFGIMTLVTLVGLNWAGFVALKYKSPQSN